MAEIERRPQVKIIGNSEYPNFKGLNGEVLGIIPPGSDSPNRIIVKLQDGPVINFRPEDLRIVKSKKAKGIKFTG